VEALGFRVRVGESCTATTRRGYAAADPEVRAKDLMDGFQDREVKAIWCVRGGSTAWELPPLLDEAVIRENPKAFIGFSDITTLHLYLNQRCGLVTYHGPTANRVLDWTEFSAESLWSALAGEKEYRNPPGEPVRPLRPGTARGPLVGGNLSLVASSIGTPWQVDARGKVLYLEDVGEGVYALERKLSQLQYAGVLDEASAVVLGAFTSCRNAYCPDYGPEELVADFFGGYPKPVLFNVRSAHCWPMSTLPMGAECTVDGDNGTMEFTY
jgi:muramoyltetrapeptide carboxypeptidase